MARLAGALYFWAAPARPSSGSALLTQPGKKKDREASMLITFRNWESMCPANDGESCSAPRCCKVGEDRKHDRGCQYFLRDFYHARRRLGRFRARADRVATRSETVDRDGRRLDGLDGPANRTHHFSMAHPGAARRQAEPHDPCAIRTDRNGAIVIGWITISIGAWSRE